MGCRKKKQTNKQGWYAFLLEVLGAVWWPRAGVWRRGNMTTTTATTLCSSRRQEHLARLPHAADNARLSRKAGGEVHMRPVHAAQPFLPNAGERHTDNMEWRRPKACVASQ